jgi:protein-disulfide isomerase-like protein with CxxC motif
MKLVLVAGPMCSWCYGCRKEMTALVDWCPDISLENVVGVLGAGATDVLDDPVSGFAWNIGQGSKRSAGCHSTVKG